MSDTQEQQQFLDEFSKESDRAAAVLGGAYLDTILEQMIAARLVGSGESPIGGNILKRALQSFASRVSAAFTLGLILEWEARDLSVVNKIRNEFAHRIHGLSFGEARIMDYCREFSFTERPTELAEGEQARLVYMTAVVVLMIKLRNRIPTIDRLDQFTYESGARIRVGMPGRATA